MIIPRSTYRLQFTPSFTFNNAFEIQDYLFDLGISHIYASPIFTATPGSDHGYDITDPSSINPELGGEEEFNKLTDSLKKYPLYWLQDVVPNHMAFNGHNPFLVSILENGPQSPYFHFFDIDWDHPYESIHNKVLAPFLGQFYGRALEQGEIQLVYDIEGLGIKYYDLRLPLRIDTYTEVFTHNLPSLKRRLGKEHPDYIHFLGIIYMFRNQPEVEEKLLDIDDHIRFVKQLLWNLFQSSEDIREYILEIISFYNGQRGDPASYNPIDALLEKQYFQLSYWKVASEEINYKRFFNVNGLISLNVDHKEVFQATHKLVARLLRQNRIQGLRIDHIDGLYDPAMYLARIHEISDNCYTVVEKILEGDEKLPGSWNTEGTTGYDFMNKLCGIFIQTKNHQEFSRLYSNFTNIRTMTEELMYDKKRLIIRMHLSGELDNLARQLKMISSHYRYSSDLTFSGLKEAIEEVMVYFPIYRTYVSSRDFSEQDHNIIRRGINRAAAQKIKLRFELEFLQKVLLLDFEEHIPENIKVEWLDFVMRFQQFTGPLLAKGMEDTVFYIFNRLLALNEVGGNPGIFGYPLQDFHQYNIYKREHWPYTLNATTTHDTKRSEDNRMRLAVLSEIPREWNEKIRSWHNMNRPWKKIVAGKKVPDRNEEYFLYQTLIGSWPFTAEFDLTEYVKRVQDYIIKAVREAKMHTAWIEPDLNYEAAYLDYIKQILDPVKNQVFLNDFKDFQQNVAFYGVYNSLAQAVIKVTTPGIPDFYQGTELWDLSLVDPDNRRPIDFQLRRQYLQEIKLNYLHPPTDWLSEMLGNYCDGRIKLYLIFQALKLRSAFPGLLEKGTYLPLATDGLYAPSVLCYLRQDEKNKIIVILPRFVTQVISWRTSKFPPLGREVWADTSVTLSPDLQGTWLNILDNQEYQFQNNIFLSDVFSTLPFAVLIAR